MTSELTISQAVRANLERPWVKSTSAHTFATYSDTLDLPLETLRWRQIDPETAPLASLPEQAIA